MTQKRKAELQRKLSMAPVAKPPSNLADRIKADIPEYLSPQRDRERVNRSLAFSLRVAASIVLLVTSVFLTVEFLSRDQAQQQEFRMAATEKKEVQALEPAVAAPQMAMNDQAMSGVAAERRLDVPPPAPAVPPPPPPAPAVSEGGATAFDAVIEVQAEAARLTAAPAQAYASAVEPPPARAEAAEAGATLGRVQKVTAVAAATTAPAAAVPPPVLQEKVDVEALVNHFAGPPQEPSSEVRLEVEASRAPLTEDGRAVIRYTIDMPAAGEQPNVTRANLSIALETGVIESYRTIGSVRPLRDAAGMLADGESATGLVEIKLSPGTRSYQRVATILLDYVSPATGRKKHARKVIYAHDLDRGWSSASRRHRLATLSAVWGESLTGSPRPAELAQVAAALAEEAPGDALAQELAKATASSRPRSSSPTGSGR